MYKLLTLIKVYMRYFIAISLYISTLLSANAFASSSSDNDYQADNYELFVTSKRPIYSSRSFGKISKEDLAIIKNIDLKRTSCNDDANCSLNCANAAALSGYIYYHVKYKFESELAGIESIAADKLEQCIAGNNDPKYHLAILHLEKLKTQFFSKTLSKALAQNKIKKVVVANKNKTFDEKLFFEKFKISDSAKYKDNTKQEMSTFKNNFTDVVVSMVTLANYCSLKDKSCSAKTRSLDYRSLSFYNILFSGLYGLEAERNAANYLLDNVLRVSKNKAIEKKSSFSVYRYIREYPEEHWSPAMLVADSFAKELLNRNSHKILDIPRRLYCTANNKDNPFINYSACEYFSALYYGDFHMVAIYDLIFTESVQLNLAYQTLSVDDIWAKLYMENEAKNPQNPKVGSLIQYILVNYMMNYSASYKKCLSANAKTYTYNYEKITEMKNRWGFTLNSWNTHTSESFKVNPNLVPIYETSPFIMSTKGNDFQVLIQTLNTENEAISRTEERYGLSHIGSNSILNTLDSFMKTTPCDSHIALKMEEQLIAYNEVRKEYDVIIAKQPFVSILFDR
jgi:hypothetical protein